MLALDLSCLLGFKGFEMPDDGSRITADPGVFVKSFILSDKIIKIVVVCTF